MLKPLPDSWIDRIFMRLIGVYGREFKSQFSHVVDGVDIGIENAKLVWAEELAGFEQNPQAIAYALETLPDRAPNAIRFRDACRRAPEIAKPKLEHKLSAEQMAANKRRIQEMMATLKGNHGTRLGNG